jgi:hypothetical protein
MAQLKPITNRMRGEAPSAVQRHIGAERTTLKVIWTSPRGYAMIFRSASSNCQPKAPAATLLLRSCRAANGCAGAHRDDRHNWSVCSASRRKCFLRL